MTRQARSPRHRWSSSSSSGRRGPRAPALLVMLAVAASAGVAACQPEQGPVTDCPAAYTLLGAMPQATAVAGQWYSQHLPFRMYPCVAGSGGGCGLTSSIDPFCGGGGSVQSYCQPALTILQGPPGATTRPDGSIGWTPGLDAAGQVVHFEVQTVYPSFCDQVKLAWDVTVLPAASSTARIDGSAD